MRYTDGSASTQSQTPTITHAYAAWGGYMRMPVHIQRPYPAIPRTLSISFLDRTAAAACERIFDFSQLLLELGAGEAPLLFR